VAVSTPIVCRLVAQGGVARITAAGARVALTAMEKSALGRQEAAIRLIEELLARDPGWRPTAEELQSRVHAAEYTCSGPVAQ